MQNVLITTIQRLIPLKHLKEVDYILISNIIVALGYLKVDIINDQKMKQLMNEYFIPSIQQMLLFDDNNTYTSITNNNNSIQRYELYSNISCNIINGFSRLEISYNELPISIQIMIIDILNKYSIYLNTPSQVATLLWSLARLHINYYDLNINIQDKLMNNIKKTILKMNGHEFTWLLWSLSRIKYTFITLPYSLQSLIINQCIQVVLVMNNEEFGLLLWSLNKLQIQINDLPNDVKNYLVQHINNIATIQPNK